MRSDTSQRPVAISISTCATPCPSFGRSRPAIVTTDACRASSYSLGSTTNPFTLTCMGPARCPHDGHGALRRVFHPKTGHARAGALVPALPLDRAYAPAGQRHEATVFHDRLKKTRTDCKKGRQRNGADKQQGRDQRVLGMHGRFLSWRCCAFGRAGKRKPRRVPPAKPAPGRRRPRGASQPFAGATTITPNSRFPGKGGRH